MCSVHPLSRTALVAEDGGGTNIQTVGSLIVVLFDLVRTVGDVDVSLNSR